MAGGPSRSLKVYDPFHRDSGSRSMGFGVNRDGSSFDRWFKGSRLAAPGATTPNSKGRSRPWMGSAVFLDLSVTQTKEGEDEQ